MNKLDTATSHPCHGSDTTVQPLASLDQLTIFLSFEDAEEALGGVFAVVEDLDLKWIVNLSHLFFKPEKAFDDRC